MCSKDCGVCEHGDYVKYYDPRRHKLCVTFYCTKGEAPDITYGRKLNSRHYYKVNN